MKNTVALKVWRCQQTKGFWLSLTFLGGPLASFKCNKGFMDNNLSQELGLLLGPNLRPKKDQERVLQHLVEDQAEAGTLHKPLAVFTPVGPV